MRNLSRFLDNPFDDGGIGIAKLIAFSTDCLQRMIANNPSGELSARITALTSALGQVTDCVTDDQTKLGVRKARKMAKDAFRKSILDNVAKIIAAVTAEYGQGSPEVTECVPSGRSVFTDCQDDEVSGHLETLINGVTAHQATLGAPLVTKATALKTAWVTVYNASETSTGAKTATEEEKQLARENLQLMLFLTLLKLAEMFPRQPEKLALYMQQSLLEVPGGEEEEPEPPVPPPPPPTP